MIRHGNITIDRKTLTVTHGWAAHKWQCQGGNNRRFLVVQHLLLSAGLTTREVFDLLYDDDPDGGPIGGFQIVHILLCQMQPQFDKLHLTLCRCRHNSEMIYWLAAKENVVGQAA